MKIDKVSSSECSWLDPEMKRVLTGCLTIVVGMICVVLVIVDWRALGILLAVTAASGFLLALFWGRRWKRHYEAAQVSFGQAKYEQAQRSSLAALKEADRLSHIFSKENWRYVLSLVKLGDCYFAQKNYAEAESVYQRALALAKKTFGSKSLLVPILNNLAGVYQTQGKYSEAKPLMARLLEVQEKWLGQEHSDLAATLENYAALLRKMDREAEAEKLEHRARAIRARQGRELNGVNPHHST